MFCLLGTYHYAITPHFQLKILKSDTRANYRYLKIASISELILQLKINTRNYYQVFGRSKHVASYHGKKMMIICSLEI